MAGARLAATFLDAACLAEATAVLLAATLTVVPIAFLRRTAGLAGASLATVVALVVRGARVFLAVGSSSSVV